MEHLLMSETRLVAVTKTSTEVHTTEAALNHDVAICDGDHA